MNKVFEIGSVVGWVGLIQYHAGLICPLIGQFLFSQLRDEPNCDQWKYALSWGKK